MLRRVTFIHHFLWWNNFEIKFLDLLQLPTRSRIFLWHLLLPLFCISYIMCIIITINFCSIIKLKHCSFFQNTIYLKYSLWDVSPVQFINWWNIQGSHTYLRKNCSATYWIWIQHTMKFFLINKVELYISFIIKIFRKQNRFESFVPEGS